MNLQGVFGCGCFSLFFSEGTPFLRVFKGHQQVSTENRSWSPRTTQGLRRAARPSERALALCEGSSRRQPQPQVSPAPAPGIPRSKGSPTGKNPHLDVFSREVRISRYPLFPGNFLSVLVKTNPPQIKGKSTQLGDLVHKTPQISCSLVECPVTQPVGQDTKTPKLSSCWTNSANCYSQTGKEGTTSSKEPDT